MIGTFEKNHSRLEIFTPVEYSTRSAKIVKQTHFWTQTSNSQGFFISMDMFQNHLKDVSTWPKPNFVT